jgi:dynein heavy chain, axonemal
VLNYLGGAINYGGRVTDDKDKRLITCILQSYINPDLVSKGAGYKFSGSGVYYCPDAGSQQEFLDFISKLPLQPSPEVRDDDDDDDDDYFFRFLACMRIVRSVF